MRGNKCKLTDSDADINLTSDEVRDKTNAEINSVNSAWKCVLASCKYLHCNSRADEDF